MSDQDSKTHESLVTDKGTEKHLLHQQRIDKRMDRSCGVE